MQQALTIFKRILFLCCLSWAFTSSSLAQQPVDTSNIPMPVLGPNDTIPVPAIIHQNEWIPGNYLEWFYVSARIKQEKKCADRI